LAKTAACRLQSYIHTNNLKLEHERAPNQMRNTCQMEKQRKRGEAAREEERGGGSHSLVLFIAGLSNGFSIPQPLAESPCLPAAHLSRSTPHILLLTFPHPGAASTSRGNRGSAERVTQVRQPPGSGWRRGCPPLASAAGGHTLARATIAQRPWVDKCGRRTRPIRRVVCFLWHLAATHICLFSPSTLVEFLCGRRRAVLHFD